MNDITAAETTNGECVLIEIDETAATIEFRDENDTHLAAYGFDAFASITGAFAVKLGADLILNADTVAGIQQWANLDAHGLAMRNGR